MGWGRTEGEVEELTLKEGGDRGGGQLLLYLTREKFNLPARRRDGEDPHL